MVVGALMSPVRRVAELLLPLARWVAGPLVLRAPGGWSAWRVAELLLPGRRRVADL